MYIKHTYIYKCTIAYICARCRKRVKNHSGNVTQSRNFRKINVRGAKEGGVDLVSALDNSSRTVFFLLHIRIFSNIKLQTRKC